MSDDNATPQQPSPAPPSSNTTTSSPPPKKGSKKRWYPLESNPTLLNNYISKLGFSTALYQFHDVYSTEEWALSMIPPGTIAVIMLYPLTPIQEAHRIQQAKEMTQRTTTTTTTSDAREAEVWFTKQRIGNACGTIGILHALANLPPPIMEMTIQPDSWLSRFYASTPKSMDPIRKAELLETNEEIDAKHDAATSDPSNQTSRGRLDEKVLTHFVALVNVGGQMWELDGRKEGPVGHGNTTEGTFLVDACRVVKGFMERDPEQVKFTILALAPAQD